MDLSQFNIKVPQSSKSSLMKSISYMWIISGVVLMIVGIWAGLIYSLLSPYRDKILQNAYKSGAPSYSGVINSIDFLPYIGIILTIVALTSIVSGFQFRRFKEWALSTIHILSYVMLFISGFLGIIWFKLWWFTIEHSQPSPWNYVGLFVGIFACIVYIGILIYFIKSIRTKQFREAYKNKMII